MRTRSSLTCFMLAVVCPYMHGYALAQETFGSSDASPARTPKPGFVPWSLQFGFDFDSNPLLALTLGPVDERALFAQDAQVAATGDKTLRYGLGREFVLTIDDGVWHDLGQDRWLWTADLVSPGAVGLRVHLAEMDLPAGGQVIVWSPLDRARVSGPYGHRGVHDTGDVWTPTRAGERARIEYLVEGILPRDARSNTPFVVTGVQHVYRDPNKIAQFVGAGSCHNDVTCFSSYDNLKNACAGIGTIGSNAIYCSGTQLATTSGDQSPYLLTANHCLSTNADSQNAEVFWKYQTPMCAGTPPTVASVPLSAVCTLVSTSTYSDYTLLMVEGGIPSGLAWAGWTSVPAAGGTPGVCIHHPSGDFKRISFGNYSTTSECSSTGHHRVNWTNGPTESGSSGAGFFRVDTQQLLGQLHCGPSACGNETYDGFGRFADTYPFVSGYLAAGSDDTFEGNDACGGLPDIAAGTYTGLVVKSVDDDWYEISVPNGAMLTVSLDFTHANGDIDAQLWVNCGDTTYADVSQGASDAERISWVNDTGSANTVAWRVYLYSDTRNAYDMVVSLTPPNNFCANAVTLMDNVTVAGSTVNASTSVSGTCGSSTNSHDVWYTYTASATGILQVSTCGSALDTVVTVYDDCTFATLLVCNQDAGAGSVCGYTTQSSFLTLPVVSGADYKIRVAGRDNLDGAFLIRVDTDAGGSFCLGDGLSAVACPCANSSATVLEAGCLNSTGTSGRLSGTGVADVSADTVVLNGSGMPPNSTCLFFQGTAKQASGAGVAFGDGLRCVAGSQTRLASKTNSATGTSTFPTGLDPDVSVKGLVPSSGGARYYQIWYRNAAAYCSTSTFNLTNGYELFWIP